MHTIMILVGGFLLLALCLLVGRMQGRRPALARAALVFIPLWLIGAAINMAVGVLQAGYSVAEELPIFLAIFAIPTAPAALLWWRFKRS
ncbi:hypothetical protein GCM10025770_20140 [Viridibacterium curvum]|uniref:Uncharacterized protein n=2 Tax=Viridibacterium curvum TaxID=1101404 RepID=A0ABP9QP86_9RHOO